ncbi:MAG TPA: hypothetical protein PKB10_02955 [Tepidisphaeraceae bacterium]|nr:hypothetical protein [Tepidisphaeraceae bacterium]
MILTAEQFERITKTLKSERSRSDERRVNPRVSLSGALEVIQIVASDRPIVPFRARLRPPGSGCSSPRRCRKDAGWW